MTVTCWNHEGQPENINVREKEELLRFFDSFVDREPCYCEFVENASKLSVCIRRDLGSVQHSSANNSPPYMVALTGVNLDTDGEADFFIGNEATPVSSRHVLPLEVVKQIIVYFQGTGHRYPCVAWEAV